MTNICQRTTVGTAVSGPPVCGPNQWSCSSGIAYLSGATQTGTSSALWIPVNGAFDADQYGITCQAFANASTSIVSLQSAITSIQTQVNLLTNLSNSSSVGFTERMSDQSAVWSLFLVAAVVVLCVRGIYNLFNRSPHEGS